MVLTALGLTVAAMVGTLILRSYLIGEVDHQLAGNSRFADGNLPQMPMNSSDPGSMPGQGTATSAAEPLCRHQVELGRHRAGAGPR